MHDLTLLSIAFGLGCLLIHAGRAHARATTVLLSATAVTLSLTVGGLFWPGAVPAVEFAQ